MMRGRKIIPERRKRYGWLVFLTMIAWLVLAAMILLVDPENVRDLIFPGGYFIFISLASVAIFLLLTIVFLSAKRAILWTGGAIVFFYLRVYGLGSWLNGMLILGILICLELYLKMGYTLRQTSIN